MKERSGGSDDGGKKGAGETERTRGPEGWGRFGKLSFEIRKVVKAQDGDRHPSGGSSVFIFIVLLVFSNEAKMPLAGC